MHFLTGASSFVYSNYGGLTTYKVSELGKAITPTYDVREIAMSTLQGVHLAIR